MPALREAFIEIRSYYPLVQLRATDVLEAIQRVLMVVVLHKAEAARCLVEAVEAHDEPFDLTALAEEFVDLLFGGVEGEVADVESGCICELLFQIG